jgi:hypothetical protein
MQTTEEINQYISGLSGSRRADMHTLHQHMLNNFPDSKLWYFDGKDESGKIVSNPQIGYGSFIHKTADGKSKEMFRVGISANTSGVSVYIMGLDDKQYLPNTYAPTMGKAQITGYCIKFRSLKDVYFDTLEAAIRDGIEHVR